MSRDEPERSRSDEERSVDPTADWDAVADYVAQRLRALADGAKLTVQAIDDHARPAKVPGLMKKLLGQEYPMVAPWVSIERSEDHAIARTVSNHKEIGFPLSPEEKDQLIALGWREPGPSDGPALLRWIPDDVPREVYLPEEEAAEAASLAIATLREVFCVEEGRNVHVRTDD